MHENDEASKNTQVNYGRQETEPGSEDVREAKNLAFRLKLIISISIIRYMSG